MKAKIEGKSVDTLNKAIKGLEDELGRSSTEHARDIKRIDELELGQSVLRKRITTLEIGKSNNDIAFASLSFCEFYRKTNKCPIINKKKDLENGNKKIVCSKSSSKKA